VIQPKSRMRRGSDRLPRLHAAHVLAGVQDCDVDQRPNRRLHLTGLMAVMADAACPES